MLPVLLIILLVILLLPSVLQLLLRRWGHLGVMVKVQDSGIVVREFELQSHHYVQFRTNALRKGMNPLIPKALG